MVVRKSKRSINVWYGRRETKGIHSHADKGPNFQILRIFNKASTPFVDSQADSIASIHILELGGTQHNRKKGRDGVHTVNSLVLCKLSISSILFLTDSSFSSKPSSSTTSRAAWRISNESGRTLWLMSMLIMLRRSSSETGIN